MNPIMLIVLLMVGAPAGAAIATLFLSMGPTPAQADLAVAAITDAFGAGTFAPHIFCLADQAGLIGLTIAGDATTFFAYVLIPIGLAVVARDIQQQRYGWNALMIQATKYWWLVALFVLLCGGGHFVRIINLFAAQYWFEAYWGLATGLVSLVTAVAIVAARSATLEARSNG